MNALKFLQQFDPADDLGHSVRINFELSLGREFMPLLHWFAGEVFRFAFDFPRRPLPRGSTMDQVHETLDCILANLLNCHRIKQGAFLAISMGAGDFKRGRYNKRGIGYQNFRRAIHFLRDANPLFIEYFRGFNDRRTGKGRTTRIRPTETLLRLLEGYQTLIEGGVGQRDRLNMNEIVAELIAERRKPKVEIPLSRLLVRAVASDVIRLRDTNKRQIEYEDTDLTRGMRERLESFNDFTAENFHIDLLLPDKELLEVMNRRNADGEFEKEIFYGDRQEDTRFVDFTRNRLHRVFNNGSFDLGGRFYGAWWQAVPRRYRPFITINGKPTIEIDYSSLHPMMLYARDNAPFPEEPYAIEGINPDYRPLIKTTFNKLINASPTQRIRPPRQNELPEGWSWRRLQEAVTEKHAAIGRHLGSGVGLELQRVDAEIAERVMLNFQAMDYPVLPVHDSFLTFSWLGDKLRKVMENAYYAVMGAGIGTKSQPSDFEQRWIEGLPIEEQRSPMEWVEGLPQHAGYEGYRSRSAVFFESRTDEWHRRFGELNMREWPLPAA